MNWVVFFVLLTQLCVVSWIDIKSKKIFNSWLFVNLVLSVAFHFLYPQLYPLSWEILIFPLGWIVLGFLLYLLGIMGAGDSKYLASLFLTVPLEQQMFFLEKIILSTFLVGGILLAYGLAKNFVTLKAYLLSSHWRGIKNTIKSKFSYAPVILLAWILTGIQAWK